MNVLVDTSVWSLALRRAPHHRSQAEQSVVAELAELIDEGRAKLIGLIRQELLSGIRNPSQFEKLRQRLRPFSDEQVEIYDYEAAAAMGNQCRMRGLAISPADMLVCAVAESRGWAVYSTGADFQRYATVLPIQLHTVRSTVRGPR